LATTTLFRIAPVKPKIPQLQILQLQLTLVKSKPVLQAEPTELLNTINSFVLKICSTTLQFMPEEVFIATHFNYYLMLN
jgi:hypothetical protein